MNNGGENDEESQQQAAGIIRRAGSTAQETGEGHHHPQSTQLLSLRQRQISRSVDDQEDDEQKEEYIIFSTVHQQEQPSGQQQNVIRHRRRSSGQDIISTSTWKTKWRRRKKRKRIDKYNPFIILTSRIISFACLIMSVVFTNVFLYYNVHLRRNIITSFRYCYQRERYLYRLLILLIVILLYIQTRYDPFMTWRKVDHYLSYCVMRRQFVKVQLELRKAGIIDLIPTTKVNHANNINTHVALRELVLRRAKRAQTLQQLEQQALHCDNHSNNDNGPKHHQEQQRRTLLCPTRIPPVFFVPHLGPSFYWESPPIRPGPLLRRNYTLLDYDNIEMRQVVEDVSYNLHPPNNGLLLSHDDNHRDVRSTLLRIYDRLVTHDDRVHLWALCVIYLYGGVFSWKDTALHRQQPRQEKSLLETLLLRNDSLVGHEKTSNSPWGLAVLELISTGDNSSTATEVLQQQRVLFLAASPRHPFLSCTLRGLEQQNQAEFVHLATPGTLLRHAIRMMRLDRVTSLPADDWYRLSQQGGSRVKTSCDTPITSELVKEIPTNHKAGQEMGSSLYVRHVSIAQDSDTVASEINPVTVEVFEDTAEAANSENNNARVQKVTLKSQMRKVGAEPGWFCNRCLNWAAYGSYKQCHAVCPAVYQTLMCNATASLEKKDIDVDIIVRRASEVPRSKAIPRIVHQTWFEDITYDRYPQLARLQASWKRSGWEFRFYTDETARNYIVDNYPLRFVEAFDALIHGAFKADLFRYLVLLKEGGVYADVDVMLETSLDDFITPYMSFFAPRDIPCEYAGEPYCLWNGFLGSSPGNPIMVRMVERLLNFIQERADIYDMEQETCYRVGESMDVWKVRAQPVLFLSGPCGLGAAVNEALSMPSLQRLPTGWIGMDELDVGGQRDHGDALILVGDKYDLGEFRISDPERGLVVASTGISDLDKSPKDWGSATGGERRRAIFRRSPSTHYSKSKKGVWVWGMENVYTDSFVAKECVRLRVKY